MPKKKSLHGQVRRVMLGNSPNTLVTQIVPQIEVALDGFKGDVHSGPTLITGARQRQYPRGTLIKNNRQVSLVSLEELAEVAAKMQIPLIEPEWLGANLCLQDIPDLTLLPSATRLFFPDRAVLVIEGENEPCTGPGHVIQKQYAQNAKLATTFPKAAWRKRGLVGWVERAGTISEGDTVRIELPAYAQGLVRM